VIFFRPSGQIYSRLVASFFRIPYTKNCWNRLIFDWVIRKIKRVTFLGHIVEGAYVKHLWRWSSTYAHQNMSCFFLSGLRLEHGWRDHNLTLLNTSPDSLISWGWGYPSSCPPFLHLRCIVSLRLQTLGPKCMATYIHPRRVSRL